MPSTRRRFLLSAALAGLAGCAGSEPTNSAETTTETTGIETTATDSRTTASRETPKEPATVEPRRETPVSEAVRWRVETDSPVVHPQAVGDGTVYVPVGTVEISESDEPDDSGWIVALDADDGAPRWTVELPAGPMDEPHIRDSGVYCITGGSGGFWGIDNRLVRFDPDGTERWRTDGVDQFLNVVAFGDGRAYLATSDDALGLDGQRLFGVDLASGEAEWSVEIGDAFRGRYLDGTLVVAYGGDRALGGFDPATGDPRWTKEDIQPLGTRTGSFSVADGAVFGEASEDDARFVAFDAADGSERWSYRPDDDERFSPISAGVLGDAVVGLTYRGRAFGLDAADGTERWTFDAGGEYGSLVVGDGLAVVNGSGSLHALDPATGAERWRVDGIEIRPYSAAGGTVVATGDTRHRDFVAGYDAADGTERWSFETDEDLTRPAVADGRVYVGSETGAVRALGE